MPAATATRHFSFICGQDDFLVGRMGRERFNELSKDTPDEFSREIVNGYAANVDEVETAVNRFREAVLTLPMFGGTRDRLAQGRQLPRRYRHRARRNRRSSGWRTSSRCSSPSIPGKPRSSSRRRPSTAGARSPSGVRRMRNSRWPTEAATPKASALSCWPRPACAGSASGRGPWSSSWPRSAPTRACSSQRSTSSPPTRTRDMIDEASVAELTPNAAQGDFFETADAFFSGDLAWPWRRSSATSSREATPARCLPRCRTATGS